MNRPSVLVVEDDGSIADAVLYALRKDGMVAEPAPSLAAARTLMTGRDLLILDLGLPDGSGFSLLGELRGKGAPRVIVLTSRDEDVDCVAALEAGADDFVTKPFSPRALVARARAVLRRAGASEEAPCAARDVESSAGLSIDAERRRATYAGREVSLTKLEFDLLAALAAAPGRVRTRAQLVALVWGDAYALTERTVDSHVKGVRKKLEDGGAPAALIETVRGVGFRLAEGA